MVNFTEILTKSRSVDQIERQQAEKDIDDLATSDFGLLLESCAQVLSDDNSIKENRQMCATLIKNFILHVPKHAGKWEQLQVSVKDKIKTMVLSCLATTVKEVRRAAAITVAGK